MQTPGAHQLLQRLPVAVQNESGISDYVKSLLLTLLLVKEQYNMVPELERYRYADIYRGFLERDDIGIPSSVQKYFDEIFHELPFNGSDYKEALRSYSSQNSKSLSRDDYVYSILTIFCPSWRDVSELKDQVKEEVESFENGTSKLQTLILNRMEREEDVRHLSADDLETLNRDFDVILGGIRDPQKAGLTYNAYLLLRNSWTMAYTLFKKEVRTEHMDHPTLERRRELLVEATRRADFGSRLYPQSAYPSLDSIAAAVYKFCTSFHTFKSMQKALQTDKNKPQTGQKRKLSGGLQMSQKKHRVNATPYDKNTPQPDPDAHDLMMTLNYWAADFLLPTHQVDGSLVQSLKDVLSPLQEVAKQTKPSQPGGIPTELSFIDSEDSRARLFSTLHQSIHYLHVILFYRLTEENQSILREVGKKLKNMKDSLKPI
jgi:hypothetical protein